MSTPALNRLMNNARVHLPGALDSALQQELFNALDDFCQGSRIWQEKIEVSARVDQTDYDIIPSEPGSIISLLAVVNDNDLPERATMEVPGTLVLASAPSAAATYIATVSLTVVDPTTNDYPQFPDWFLQQYGQPLLDGVVGKMMSQVAKPYSNERMAIYHLRLFRNGIARARAEALRKNLQGAQAWRFPQSFAPCRR